MTLAMFEDRNLECPIIIRPGASNILKQELEKVWMDLVALQEIIWLGNCT
jgi:hypothetical protein